MTERERDYVDKGKEKYRESEKKRDRERQTGLM